LSKSNAFETACLNLWLANSNIALVGDATGLRGSSVAGNLYFSLHTADPGEAGDQTTNEIAYTSYARVSKARNGVTITISGNTATLAGAVTFPAGTGGAGTATHWGLGTDASGAGLLMWKGAISPTIVCGSGVTPELAAGTLLTED
jgi:hypothetical protein